MIAGTQNMYGTARINGPEMIRGRDHETLRYNGTRTWDWDRSAISSKFRFLHIYSYPFLSILFCNNFHHNERRE